MIYGYFFCFNQDLAELLDDIKNKINRSSVRYTRKENLKR